MPIFKQIHIIKHQSVLILLAILISLIIPHTLNAGVIITEIMYDLQGADAGREWIEVYNTNDFDVDLSQYRFFRNNVNHRIRIFDPNEEGLSNILPSNQYAVIADGPANFLVDNPNFNGILYNSSFTLRDSGEQLSIVNPDGDIVYSVHYQPEWGARATGNSLQFNGSEWIPAVPTPGLPNATEAVNESEDEDSDDNQPSNKNTQDSQSNQNNNQQSTHSGQNPLSNYTQTIDLQAGSGRIRYGIVNSPINFEAVTNADSLNNQSDDEDSPRIRNPRYEWSFGDAGASRGQNTTHTYYHEGEYNLVLNVDYLDQSTTSRNTVIIRRPEIKLSLITSGKLVDILLENQSNFEVNFGLFSFRTMKYDQDNDDNTLILSDYNFIIPSDTIIDANSSIKIAGEQTGFKSENNQGIIMYYPNGKFAARFDSTSAGTIKNTEQLENIFNSLRHIINPEHHNQLEMLFNVFNNRLNIQNRL